ncbi:MAG: hypothetical protein WCY16_08705 [Weeksellaceae bacterium]
MKTGLDKEIKKQLNEREIQPSDAAWQKLEGMLDKQNSTKKSARIRFLILISTAASVLLMVGLFLFVKSQIEIQNIDSNFVQTQEPLIKEIKTDQTETVETEEPVLVNSNHEIKNQKTSKDNVFKIQTTEIQREVAIEKIEESKTEKPIVEEVKPMIAQQNDSVQKPKKKTDYTDPNMLLYSIEHNQSVKQNESNSKLVIIDFNKEK